MFFFQTNFIATNVIKNFSCSVFETLKIYCDVFIVYVSKAVLFCCFFLCIVLDFSVSK